MNDSENLKNDDQLLTMMEEMQDQIENLQNRIQMEQEKNLEVQKTISKVSSENLILRNKLREKSERIEKMNESDLILKKNEELEKKMLEVQNSEKKTREEAEAEVEAVKQKAREDVENAKLGCNKRVASFYQKELKVSDRELIVSAREKDLDEEITLKAKSLIENKIYDLNSQYTYKLRKLENDYSKKGNKMELKYRSMTAGYKGMVLFTFLYSTVTTIITAWKTEVFTTDFKSFINTMFTGIMTIKAWIWEVATFMAKLGDIIPQEILSVSVHWIIVIVLITGIGGGLGVLAFLIGKKYYVYFRQKQADEITVFVVLSVLIIVVFMADYIKSILSINLMDLVFVLFGVYTAIRGMIQAENKESKKKMINGVAMSIGAVGVSVIVFHFFGAIGLIAIIIGGLWAMSER